MDNNVRAEQFIKCNSHSHICTYKQWGTPSEMDLLVVVSDDCWESSSNHSRHNHSAVSLHFLSIPAWRGKGVNLYMQFLSTHIHKQTKEFLMVTNVEYSHCSSFSSLIHTLDLHMCILLNCRVTIEWTSREQLNIKYVYSRKRSS